MITDYLKSAIRYNKLSPANKFQMGQIFEMLLVKLNEADHIEFYFGGVKAFLIVVQCVRSSKLFLLPTL